MSDEPKIIGFGMTKSEKDKEDIEMLFGTEQERKKARRRAYYVAHRDKELENYRLYRAANKVKISARQAVYRAKNEESIKTYRLWYYNTFERTPPSEKTCKGCRETFVGNANKFYCSRICGARHRRRQKGPRIYLRECAFCNKEITTFRKNRIYCSHSCANRGWRLRRAEREQNDPGT